MSAAATTTHLTARPCVVIVGAGFGGLAAARALARAPADVIVVDRRNYHLFQPLLYQVATAALSPADIAWPIRAILGRQANVSVRMGKVVGVDAGSREVVLEDRPGALRLSRARHRRPPFLLRHGRMGVVGAGPEEDRRRDPHPRADAVGVRARRDLPTTRTSAGGS